MDKAGGSGRPSHLLPLLSAYGSCGCGWSLIGQGKGSGLDALSSELDVGAEHTRAADIARGYQTGRIPL